MHTARSIVGWELCSIALLTKVSVGERCTGAIIVCKELNNSDNGGNE